MSAAQLRGGIPEVFRAAADSTNGLKHRFPFITNWVRVRADHDFRMYFTQADFDGDKNYITVLASTDNVGVEMPIELEAIWFKAASTTANVECLSTQKRG